MNRVCCLALFLAALSALAAEEPKTPRTDLYGDPLPPGAVARLGTIRLRHAGADVVFSKDGKQLISCGRDGEVRFWDVATGRRVREKRLFWTWRNLQRIDRMKLSPEGATAIGCNENVLYLWDTHTGKERGRLPLRSLGSNSLLTFSPDGKLLAVQAIDEGQEWTTQIWDVVAVKKRQTLKHPLGPWLSRVAFTWDGKHLAGIIDKKAGTGKYADVVDLLLWDTATAQLIGQRKIFHQMPSSALAFSPDGKTLAVEGAGTHVVWLLEAAGLKEKARLKAPANAGPDAIDELTFSPDGRFLAAVYDARPNGGPAENGVLLWELTGTKESRWFPIRYGTHLTFAPDGKTLACGTGYAAIRLWDTATGRPLHRRPGHGGPVLALWTSPDGRVVASGWDEGIRLWDAATSEQLRVLEAGRYAIDFCLFFPDGKRLVSVGSAAACNERTPFQVWDVHGGKAPRRFEIKEAVSQTHAARISADGRRLAAIVSRKAGSGAHLLVWNLATGERLRQRPYKSEEYVYLEDGHRKVPVSSLEHAAFTPDGERVTVWLGDRVGIEEISTGYLLATLPQNLGRPILFAPDGRLLAAPVRQPKLQPDEVGRWALIETVSGEVIFYLGIGMFDRVAFTPDSRAAISVDKKKLRVWGTDTGEKLHEMAWPESIRDAQGETEICSLAALSGGRAATGMAKGDILVWDLASSTWPVRKPGHIVGRKELDAFWSDLAGDARKAHRALSVLASAPDQAVPFLKAHLRPMAEVDDKHIEKLLADLDNDSFETREAATRELIRQHYRAEPMLRRGLQGKPSLEMRRRLEAILAELKRPPVEALRTLRAIAVLERIGTPEARRILEKLAAGADALETREAQTALQRLKRRDASANGRTSP